MLYILLSPYLTSDGGVGGNWHMADENRSTDAHPFALCGESANYPYYLAPSPSAAKLTTSLNMASMPSYAPAGPDGQHSHQVLGHTHEIVFGTTTRLESVLHCHFRPQFLCSKCQDVLVRTTPPTVDLFRGPRSP